MGLCLFLCEYKFNVDNFYYVIKVYQYFSFYFIVDLRVNQRIYPIPAQGRPGDNIGRAVSNPAGCHWLQIASTS